VSYVVRNLKIYYYKFSSRREASLFSQKEDNGVSQLSYYSERQRLTNIELEIQLYLKQTNYTKLVTHTYLL